jgi:hypothetical protein
MDLQQQASSTTGFFNYWFFNHWFFNHWFFNHWLFGHWGYFRSVWHKHPVPVLQSSRLQIKLNNLLLICQKPPF